MGTLALAASPNDASITLIDFTNLAAPTRVTANPGFGSGCTIDFGDSNGVVGAVVGSDVRGIDASNPAAPAFGATVATGLSGIGTVAINGTTAAVAEMNGVRVKLVDLAGGTVTATATTTLGGNYASVAFVSPTEVVVAGTNDGRFAVIDFAASPPAVTYVNPGLALSPVLAVNGGLIVAGDTGGGTVKLYTPAGALQGTVTTAAPGIYSIGLTGHKAVIGTTNGANAYVADFTAGTSVAFNAGVGGGATVNCAGTLAVCGGVNSSTVALFDLTSSPPSQISTIDSQVPSVGSIALGSAAAATPVAHASWTPPSLAFGTVRVGMTAPLALSVTNSGTGPLNITRIASNFAAFTVTQTSLTVQPGHTGQITVTFHAGAVQSYSGNLTFTTNDAAHASVSIAMSGAGGLPSASVAPNPLDLGSVPVCLTNHGTVTVTNSGPVPLQVSSATTSAPFSVSPSSLTVPASSSRTLGVTFAPSSTGAATANLTLATDDPAHPSIIVTLNGTGTPEPPPGISVNPIPLAFGDVPLQYFVGLRVTIANTGPCQPLAVALSVSGTGFFVTQADPTTLPPNSTTASGTVVPGIPMRFVVVFAPSANGPQAGTLTVTSNDPANPVVNVPLSGNGVTPSPASVELVLDRSGSMAGSAPEGTRMDALHLAVRLFADLVIAGTGDAMGSVQFDDQHSVLTPLADFDATQRGTIETDSDSLTPRGMTSIGGGLDVALQALTPATTPRKVAIVFTDGLENTAPMIATEEPGLLAAGIECYAVGLGQPQDISTAALSQLANSANGKFFLTSDTLELRKNFVQVLADAFRHSAAADPIHTIQPGQTMGLPVQLTSCERRLSFVAMWDDPASQLDLTVEAPDGTVYSPGAASSNLLVRYVHRPGYGFFQITLPEIDPGSGITLGPLPIGTWTFRLHARALAGATERVATQVLVESEVALRSRLAALDVSTPAMLQASVTHLSQPLTAAKVWAEITPPRKSLRATMTPQVVARALDGDVNPIPLHRTRMGKPFRVDLKPMKDESAKRGITHTGRVKLPAVDGVYHVEVHATGQACGGRFERFEAYDVYIGPRVDKRRTRITAAFVEPNRADVILTPRDQAGKELGPGHAHEIRVTGVRATALSIQDLRNGDYRVTACWAPGARNPSLTLALRDAEWSIPLSGRTKTASGRGVAAKKPTPRKPERKTKR